MLRGFFGLLTLLWVASFAVGQNTNSRTRPRASDLGLKIGILPAGSIMSSLIYSHCILKMVCEPDIFLHWAAVVPLGKTGNAPFMDYLSRVGAIVRAHYGTAHLSQVRERYLSSKLEGRALL